jgi:hypothetical protein
MQVQGDTYNQYHEKMMVVHVLTCHEKDHHIGGHRERIYFCVGVGYYYGEVIHGFLFIVWLGTILRSRSHSKSY